MSNIYIFGALLLSLCTGTLEANASDNQAQVSAFFQDAEGNSAVAFYGEKVSIHFGNGKNVWFEKEFGMAEEDAVHTVTHELLPNKSSEGAVQDRIRILTTDRVIRETEEWDGYVAPIRASSRIRIFDLSGNIQEDYVVMGDGYFFVSPLGRFTLFRDLEGNGELYFRSKKIRSIPGPIGSPVYSLNEKYMVIPSLGRDESNGFHLSMLLRMSDNTVLLKDKVLVDELFSEGSINYLSDDGEAFFVGENLPDHPARKVRIK